MRGRVLTRSFTFETRQHSLFGVDLGEGFPRRALLIGVLLLAFWFGFLTLLFGLPTPQTLLFYFSLPLIGIWFGLRTSTKVCRRRRMTDWLLHARYVLYAHEGVVNGQRARRRRDRLSLRERLTFQWVRDFFGSTNKDWDPWAPTSSTQRPFEGQRPITTGQRVVLYGFDAMNDRRKHG